MWKTKSNNWPRACIFTNTTSLTNHVTVCKWLQLHTGSHAWPLLDPTADDTKNRVTKEKDNSRPHTQSAAVIQTGRASLLTRWPLRCVSSDSWIRWRCARALLPQRPGRPVRHQTKDRAKSSSPSSTFGLLRPNRCATITPVVGVPRKGTEGAITRPSSTGGGKRCHKAYTWTCQGGVYRIALPSPKNIFLFEKAFFMKKIALLFIDRICWIKTSTAKPLFYRHGALFFNPSPIVVFCWRWRSIRG